MRMLEDILDYIRSCQTRWKNAVFSAYQSIICSGVNRMEKSRWRTLWIRLFCGICQVLILNLFQVGGWPVLVGDNWEEKNWWGFDQNCCFLLIYKRSIHKVWLSYILIRASASVPIFWGQRFGLFNLLGVIVINIFSLQLHSNHAIYPIINYWVGY